jgi:hypothetical protein
MFLHTREVGEPKLINPTEEIQKASLVCGRFLHYQNIYKLKNINYGIK